MREKRDEIPHPFVFFFKKSQTRSRREPLGIDKGHLLNLQTLLYQVTATQFEAA